MSLDIFLIHGIGQKFDPSSYDDFVNGIRKYLPLDSDIVWHPIDYSSLLAPREAKIYSWMKHLPWPKVRRFACDFIGDVLAYGYPKRPPEEGDFIHDLNKLLGQEFAKCRDNSKRVIIGHSLGSIVGYGATFDFKTDCLIVMGSPFCYFSVRYKNFGEMNPDLPQFHNFWRGRDPVSTIISKNPNFKMVHDYEVKSFNPLNQFMLRSHGIYWKSKFVHEKIAKIIQSLA